MLIMLVLLHSVTSLSFLPVGSPQYCSTEQKRSPTSAPDTLDRITLHHDGDCSFNSISISSRCGMAGAVPGRVTEIPAVADPKYAASSGFFPPAREAAKPPTKASPAPVVSTTLPAANGGI